MFDHLYRFVATLLFTLVLYYDSRLPLWVDWLVAIAAIAGGIAATVAILKWRRASVAERIQLRVGNTGGFTLTVATIAAKAGVTEKAAAKALLRLERKGLARRASEDAWHIGTRSRDPY